LFCVGSRSSGYLSLGVEARMHETTLTAGVSSLVLNEIQRIDVTNPALTSAEQVKWNDLFLKTFFLLFKFRVALIQQIQQTELLKFNHYSSIFQHFKSVFVVFIQVKLFYFEQNFLWNFSSSAIQTGQPTPVAIQIALNDLPTIAPLSVSVSATSTLYIITFPAEMGDVPLLTCISSSTNAPNATEVVQGVASGSKIAFALDGQLTNYVDFTTNVTNTSLYTTINNLFGIRCPPSINNPTVTPSIVYLQDFENCVYDDTPVTTNAFCGQCSSNTNILIGSNSASGNILCFAYRVLNSYVIYLNLGIQVNGDTSTTTWPTLSFSPKADKLWHYVCIDVSARLISQSSIDPSVSSILITYASLTNDIKQGIFIDAVTIRTALPNGYEDPSTFPIDQSANSSCVFPFYYNGNSYPACTLDNNNMPICADSHNQTYPCQSSSIEGVRRLYPKHQLVYNTLKLTYTASSSLFTVKFRYSDCTNPTQIVPWPSTVNIFWIN
jgi:hypothetical protein